MSLRAAAVVLGSGLLLCSCAGRSLTPARPYRPTARTEHTQTRRPASSGTTASAYGSRQYYDQRRQRYYYYDPSRRAYFWEDGSPKT